jgi:polygalacturonase
MFTHPIPPSSSFFMNSFLGRALLVFVSVVSTFWTSACAAEVEVSAVENVRPARPKIPDRTFSLTDFGAVGDGTTLNTDAFKKAVAAVEKAGGGKLVVPKGFFRTQPFALCSNLDLHLDEGAMIQAPATFGDYGLPDPATLHSQEEVRAKGKIAEPLITGRDLHDVALTGTGKIDGNGPLWWAWSERAARRLSKTEPNRIVYRRPHLIVILGCERLLVADLTLQNSSMFHLVPKNITDLTIERVKVRAPFDAPNTDAIDPGPVTNAWIHDCDIDTGDDDIVIKSGGSNILIENCTIKHGHGLSIGSETFVGVRNMLVRHCTLDGTDNGIRIKSMRGAGGLVENVRYTDIQMKNVANAIYLDLNSGDNTRPDFKGDPTRIPAVKNILIDHVTIVNSKNAGRIVGLPDSRITAVTLRDVTLSAEKDLVVTDADKPVFENVTLQIKAGIYIEPPHMVE